MRWVLFGCAALSLVLAACGGSASATPQAEIGAGLAVPEASIEATPTSVPTPVPTATSTPSSKIAPLQPAAWAPAPVLWRNSTLPPVNAAAVIVMDEASGSVMYQQNAEAPLPPASLTKIATAVVALKEGGLDQWVTVDVDYREMPRSSVMGLLPGDMFTLRDLLYGMILPSGNDAALAVGRAVAGSDEAFVSRMNALVAGLGLVETNFKNPHGLGAPGHETSAYDLAILTRYAFTIDGFAQLVSTRSWSARGSRTISMYNSNALVGQYAGADGVKIGYTRSAGNTIVGSATRNGHRVIVVLLNAPEHQADCRELLDWAFANFVWPEA